MLGAAAATIVLPHLVDLAAVSLGAVQGAVFAGRVAHRRDIDVVGVVVVGIASGLGGSMLRDVLLGRSPAALVGNGFLAAVVCAALCGMLFAPLINRLEAPIVALDAMALGMYLVVGIGKAHQAGLAPVPAMFIGVVACTGGTVVRDVLTRQPVALVEIGSLYVVAACAGAVVCTVLIPLLGLVPAAVVAGGTTVAIRLLAYRFGWHAPRPMQVDLGWPPWRRSS